MAAAGRKNQFKVVLLGEGCVGKTSLMLRYVQDKFNDKHLTTLQVCFTLQYEPIYICDNILTIYWIYLRLAKIFLNITKHHRISNFGSCSWVRNRFPSKVIPSFLYLLFASLNDVVKNVYVKTNLLRGNLSVFISKGILYISIYITYFLLRKLLWL